jgi:hypothetical protein
MIVMATYYVSAMSYINGVPSFRCVAFFRSSCFRKVCAILFEHFELCRYTSKDYIFV